MDNYPGNINPGDIATLSLLGRGGYGGYGGGGHGGSYGNFQHDGSAIKASLDARSSGVAVDAINRAADFRSLSDQITTGDQSLSDKMDNANLNRLFADAQADRSRMAADAAKCCCENRVAAAEASAKLDAILANQVQSRSDVQHAALQAQINDLNCRGH